MRAFHGSSMRCSLCRCCNDDFTGVPDTTDYKKLLVYMKRQDGVILWKGQSGLVPNVNKVGLYTCPDRWIGNTLIYSKSGFPLTI